MSDSTRCPYCKKGKLRRGTKREEHTYKGKSIVIEQPGAWCEICAEGVLSAVDVKTTKKDIRDFRARVDGLLTSTQIRDIRIRLNLTQKKAAQICGGGPNAFSRYERSEAMPMRAISNLLRLLEKHPEEVDELLRDDREEDDKKEDDKK